VRELCHHHKPPPIPSTMTATTAMMMRVCIHYLPVFSVL
jgi:hypothetical protein